MGRKQIWKGAGCKNDRHFPCSNCCLFLPRGEGGGRYQGFVGVVVDLLMKWLVLMKVRERKKTLCWESLKERGRGGGGRDGMEMKVWWHVLHCCFFSQYIEFWGARREEKLWIGKQKRNENNNNNNNKKTKHRSRHRSVSISGSFLI